MLVRKTNNAAAHTCGVLLSCTFEIAFDRTQQHSRLHPTKTALASILHTAPVYVGVQRFFEVMWHNTSGSMPTASAITLSLVRRYSKARPFDHSIRTAVACDAAAGMF